MNLNNSNPGNQLKVNGRYVNSKLLKYLDYAANFLIALDSRVRYPTWNAKHLDFFPSYGDQSWKKLVNSNLLNQDLSVKETNTVISKVARPWDGKWRFVIFDIPETDAKLRQQIRRQLYDLGLRKLQKSVWITPLELDRWIEEIQKQVSNNSIFTFIIGQAPKANLRAEIKQLWQIDRWSDRAKKLIKKLNGMKTLAPEAKKEYWDLITEHPLLPIEFFPKDWLLLSLNTLIITLSSKLKKSV